MASLLPSWIWASVVRCVWSLAMGSPMASTYLTFGSVTAFWASLTRSRNFPLYCAVAIPTYIYTYMIFRDIDKQWHSINKNLANKKYNRSLWTLNLDWRMCIDARREPRPTETNLVRMIFVGQPYACVVDSWHISMCNPTNRTTA